MSMKARARTMCSTVLPRAGQDRVLTAGSKCIFASRQPRWALACVDNRRVIRRRCPIVSGGILDCVPVLRGITVRDQHAWADQLTTIRHTIGVAPAQRLAALSPRARYHQATLRFSPKTGTMPFRRTQPEARRPEEAR
jgi:hypothetical protein